MKHILAFAAATFAAASLTLPAGAGPASGYDPHGKAPNSVNFGNRSDSHVLEITATQVLVCGLTLSQNNIDFGAHDFNSYDGILGNTIKGNKTVYGTVACNKKHEPVTVSVLDSAGNNTVGYEGLQGPPKEDYENLVLNYELTKDGAPASNAGPQTLSLFTHDSKGAVINGPGDVDNIYLANFQLAVQALAHVTNEAVYAGQYTGSLTVEVVPGNMST